MKKALYDVIVAGCGCAGFCAAVQSGRLGLKTLIVEKNGMPGGILTVGGNNDIAQFYAHQKPIIAGIGWEYVNRLEKMGGAHIPDMTRKVANHPYYGVRVNIPLAAHLMDEMLIEAGVDIAYEQTLCAVNSSEGDVKSIESVLISTKYGLEKVSGKIFIDCTGDGDLSVFAGAGYEIGDDGDTVPSLQPGTVRYFLSNLRLTDEQRAAVNKALTESIGDGSLRDTDTMCRPIETLIGEGGNNVNHISHINGADSDDKTLADIEGRRCVARIISALQKCGINANIEAMATETAVRETRRIKCNGYITAEDYVAARKYPDGICNSFYPIDLHRDGMQSIQQVFLDDGKVPQIPLSAMTVAGFDNLFVAGRCASGDRLANSAYRVKASCMAMGQACGAAAYAALKYSDGKTDRPDIECIKKILIENNAIVPNLGD